MRRFKCVGVTLAAPAPVKLATFPRSSPQPLYMYMHADVLSFYLSYGPTCPSQSNYHPLVKSLVCWICLRWCRPGILSETSSCHVPFWAKNKFSTRISLADVKARMLPIRLPIYSKCAEELRISHRLNNSVMCIFPPIYINFWSLPLRVSFSVSLSVHSCVLDLDVQLHVSFFFVAVCASDFVWAILF